MGIGLFCWWMQFWKSFPTKYKYWTVKNQSRRVSAGLLTYSSHQTIATSHKASDVSGNYILIRGRLFFENLIRGRLVIQKIRKKKTCRVGHHAECKTDVRWEKEKERERKRKRKRVSFLFISISFHLFCSSLYIPSTQKFSKPLFSHPKKKKKKIWTRKPP